MKKFFAFMLSIILFTSISLQAQVQAPQWQQTNGPLGGYIKSIVSANGSLFTAVYGAGVFISTDNGSSWSARNTGLTNLVICTLVTDGTNLFVGTMGGGVFMSSNSGMSWSVVNIGLYDGNITALAVRNNNMFAGTYMGNIYRSTDNGTNWTKIFSIQGSPIINALFIDDIGIVWIAGSLGRVYYLLNNSGTWGINLRIVGSGSASITSFAIADYHVYAGVSGDGVYVYDTGSGTWRPCNTGLSNLHVECLYGDGTNLYAGTFGGGVFVSTNSGTTWSEQNGLGSLDIQCITSNGQYLYAGTNGAGINRWTDADGSWTGVNKGLIGTTVNALMTAPWGRLYAATEGGGTFVTYDSGAVWNHNTQSMDENYAHALAYDGSYYYEGTTTGVFRKSNSSTWYNMGGANYISVLFADGNNLFAGTKSDGVILSTDHGMSWTQANSGLGTYQVLSFARVGSNIFAGEYGGGVYISTNNGTNWTAVNSGLPTSSYVSSLVSTGSNIFVGTLGYGVFLSTDNGTNWTSVNSDLTSMYINSLAVSPNGTSGTKLFAGTNSGVFVSTNNGTSWSSSGLTDRKINTLVVDGTYLYAGTSYNGVWRMSISQSTQNPQNPGWAVFDTSKGMPDPIVHSILVDAQDNGWIGTEGGLGKYDGNTWTNYTPYNSNFPGWTVYTSVVDGQGNKWFGTDSHGLVKFDGSNWTNYQTGNSGLPENTVYALAIDGQGNKWVGTYSGLAKYDGTNWTAYNSSNSTPDMSGMEILSLAVDGQGNKWIGTWAFGLVKFDGTNWTTYDNSNSGIPSNYVYTITPDAQGNLWIGTHLGMAKFDGINWTTYNESNSGIASNKVHAIAIDGNGNKWIGTEGGLVKFDGVNWTIYNKTNSPLSGDLVYAVTIDSHGNKWIGTDKGLAIFSGTSTYVQDNRNTRPSMIQLSQNYPNPFNPTTSIEYQLPKKGFVTIRIYDMLGRAVATLVNQDKQPGKYTVEFTASNFASGMYFYQLKMNDFTLTKKMILLK
jgi:ligand-binding sensor domain-containing protein